MDYSKILEAVLKQMLADENISSIYYGYSGRGMYGRTCTGAVTSHSPVEFMKYFAVTLMSLPREGDNDDGNDYAYFLHELSINSDNMGLDMIVYFPCYDLANPESSEGE